MAAASNVENASEGEVVARIYGLNEEKLRWLSVNGGWIIQCTTAQSGGWRIIGSTCNNISMVSGQCFAKIVPPGILNQYVLHDSVTMHLTGLAYTLLYWTTKFDIQNQSMIIQSDNVAAIAMLNDKLSAELKALKVKTKPAANDKKAEVAQVDYNAAANNAVLGVLMKKIKEIGVDRFEFIAIAAPKDKNAPKPQPLISTTLAVCPVSEKDVLAFEQTSAGLQLQRCDPPDDFFYYASSITENAHETTVDAESVALDAESLASGRGANEEEESEGVIGFCLMIFGLIIFAAIIIAPIAIAIMAYRHVSKNGFSASSPNEQQNMPGAGYQRSPYGRF